jgi:hypothetical protein
MIWDYAMRAIRVYSESDCKSEYAVKGSKDVQKFDFDRQLALPRVCRQIYPEVGTDFFRLNIFALVDRDALRHFRQNLKRAHWRVVQSVAVTMPLARQLYTPPSPPPPSPRRRRILAGKASHRFRPSLLGKVHRPCSTV